MMRRWCRSAIKTIEKCANINNAEVLQRWNFLKFVKSLGVNRSVGEISSDLSHFAGYIYMSAGHGRWWWWAGDDGVGVVVFVDEDNLLKEELCLWLRAIRYIVT